MTLTGVVWGKNYEKGEEKRGNVKKKKNLEVNGIIVQYREE
jgi:hypothetical protein